ncbi:MAG: hypothetical protein QOH68_4073 [Nocardioidaceae bacterium]|jgi:uncharacterized protein (TIGR02118 family)|nr:hypothetical protein [Nocardioidaceae bacterium]
MAATLLAMFKRPEGGDEALDTFLDRYHREHLPLIDKVPGLHGTHVERVAQSYSGEDIVLVTRMTFDDRAALDAGMASDEMRVAGRNLREIAPGLLTLVALEEDPIGRWSK